MVGGQRGRRRKQEGRSTQRTAAAKGPVPTSPEESGVLAAPETGARLWHCPGADAPSRPPGPPPKGERDSSGNLQRP